MKGRFVFRGRRLKEIAFPLGGIGTGSVSLGGSGELKDWEIFNKPNKGCILPWSFFTLWVKPSGRKPVTKVLQEPPLPPYTGASGYIRESGAGLPHINSCTFCGEYPFARIDFQDREIPLKVSLEAYNPFIPLNDKDSGIPSAIFYFTLKNTGKKKVETSIAANLFNAVGFPNYGQNINTFVDKGDICGIYMTSKKYPEDSPQFGSMALTTTWKNVTHTSCWSRTEWFDSPRFFWDDFSKDGELKERKYEPSAEGQSDVGSIALKVSIKPGESICLPIFITWHFPNFEKYWDHQEKKPVWKNYYATQFSDALDVASYIAKSEKRLYDETKLFHDTLFSSTLPDFILDAVSSQSSILKTTTCIRLEDGTFYGFEGCSPDCGCCEGSCTHVWNYAQTQAFLFPKLERSMRTADYKYNQKENGKMGFRIQLPLGSEISTFPHAAADGQMGGLIKLYRDWQLCGDNKWLKEIWPRAKKSLEYAWESTNEDRWDKDKDGVMEGIQHNTYDVEFHGPNTMMGSFYMGALRAAEEIARYLGEEEKAREYRKLFEKGSMWMDKNLWNREYYIQKVPDDKDLKYQFKTGCLSDQLIGQWFSRIVGLGDLFDIKKVKKSLKSIVKYNWKSMKNYPNLMRIYAINEEKGLLICTWPKGGRPKIPMPYCDEVWGGGIEYQVGSHLIYEGFVKEGLAIIKVLRDRYDGKKRNPWNEVECGNHYARSMGSWASLLALSGFSFSVPKKMIGFSPRINENNFKCFFSLDSGWGTFSQKVQKKSAVIKIEVVYGKLVLQTLCLGNVGSRPPLLSCESKQGGRFIASLVKVGEKIVPASLIREGKTILIRFEKPVVLEKENLQIKLA